MAEFVLPPAPGKHVEARGLRIHYEEVGRPEAVPVLMLHGLAASTAAWAAVRYHLSSRFRLVMLDLVGHGYSDRSDGFSMTLHDQMRVVVAFMEAIGLPSASVVGHSMGGGIAVLLAAGHPERVTRLVLVDALCYPVKLSLKARLALLPVLGGKAVKETYRRPALAAFLRDEVFCNPDLVTDTMIDTAFAHLETPSGRSSIQRAIEALEDPAGVAHAFRAVDSPTLVVWGAQDGIIPVAKAHQLQQDIKDCKRKLFDRCGHEAMTEKPGEFCPVVERFLGRAD